MCVMSVLSIGMYVYTAGMPGTFGGQRKASTCPGIGVIDGYESPCGNQAQFLWKSSRCC